MGCCITGLWEAMNACLLCNACRQLNLHKMCRTLVGLELRYSQLGKELEQDFAAKMQKREV